MKNIKKILFQICLVIIFEKKKNNKTCEKGGKMKIKTQATIKIKLNEANKINRIRG